MTLPVHPLTMKPVLVVWEDASEVDTTPWVASDAEHPEPALVKQVGYLISQSETMLVLTSAYYEGHYGRRQQIPMGMVRSVTELRAARKAKAPVAKTPPDPA